MKKISLLIVFLPCFLACGGMKKATSPEANWTTLFNGQDLNDWDTYLGPKYDESKSDFGEDPFGLNNDPDHVFSVVTVDGAPAIRISGQHFGGVNTKEVFENYHLQLQFKWGEKKWVPRENSVRDSGLLFHASEPHAQGWFFWMLSEEFQIQEGDSGDYWGVGGSSLKAPASKNSDGEYVYDPNGEMLPFGFTRAREEERASGRLKKAQDGENPHGQWNKVDLYCYADEAIFMVNGVLTNKVYDFKIPSGGKDVTLTKGKIQLQSEGAEIFYRNIKIMSIDQLPK